MKLRPIKTDSNFPAFVFNDEYTRLLGQLFRHADGFLLLRLAGQQRCADLVEVEEACK